MKSKKLASLLKGHIREHLQSGADSTETSLLYDTGEVEPFHGEAEIETIQELSNGSNGPRKVVALARTKPFVDCIRYEALEFASNVWASGYVQEHDEGITLSPDPASVLRHKKPGVQPISEDGKFL